MTPTPTPMPIPLPDPNTLNFWWNWWVNIAVAAATFLAVLTALFKEEIVRLWRRPELTARVSLTPPDCHLTQMTYMRHEQFLVPAQAPCYYLRIWIENTGNLRATQVQVFAAKLERLSS